MEGGVGCSADDLIIVDSKFIDIYWLRFKRIWLLRGVKFLVIMSL